ncbi:MAG TPA: BLUF domain-containing protein, partial [Patescibacteria group bacterium]|nr:BLUF domain-containing protein [Patescibacteria group bacterium]
MIHYLIYVSVRKSVCTDAEIEKILHSSVHNNSIQDITGVLLYSDIHFVQYLEGSEMSLKTCYEKIEQDVRHKFPKIIETGEIEERVFLGWNMGVRRFTPNNFEFRTSPSPDDIEAL